MQIQKYNSLPKVETGFAIIENLYAKEMFPKDKWGEEAVG
jgi:hypothetical protein